MVAVRNRENKISIPGNGFSKQAFEQQVPSLFGGESMQNPVSDFSCWRGFHLVPRRKRENPTS
jgi:hypothetical protein